MGEFYKKNKKILWLTDIIYSLDCTLWVELKKEMNKNKNWNRNF